VTNRPQGCAQQHGKDELRDARLLQALKSKSDTFLSAVVDRFPSLILLHKLRRCLLSDYPALSAHSYSNLCFAIGALSTGEFVEVMKSTDIPVRQPHLALI
jgi:hypothetical protein